VRRSLIAVVAFFGILYIFPLNIRPLIIPDETRYAEVPREMMATGNWISPHLAGLRYFEKPVLSYWLNALSLKIFGENAFGARFPSAMAAGISALMLFLLVRRYSVRASSALLTAFMLLTNLEVFALGTFNNLDGLLAMFLTLAMSFFFFAHQELFLPKKIMYLALCGLFCGLAFMTKGFLALVFPVIAILPFMVWEKRWKELFWITWIPLGAAVAVVLPWALAVHSREPDFWHYFFWVEHVQRFMSDMPQHPKPFWYFLPVVVIGALPWSAVFPAAVKGLRRVGFKDPFLRFALCWFVFPFLFFSASAGKLPTYILPCFPPLAIMASIGILQYFEEGHGELFSIPTIVLGMLVAILACSVVMSQVTGLFPVKAFRPVETWKWVVLSTGLLIGCLGFIWAARIPQHWKALGFLGSALVPFLFSVSFCLPDRIKEHKAPVEFLRQHAQRLQPDTVLVVDEKIVTAVCWVYKRQDIILLEWGGELDYALTYRNAKRRFVYIKPFKKLLRRTAGQGRIVIIADKNIYKDIAEPGVEPVFEDRYGDFVFAQY